MVMAFIKTKSVHRPAKSPSQSHHQPHSDVVLGSTAYEGLWPSLSRLAILGLPRACTATEAARASSTLREKAVMALIILLTGETLTQWPREAEKEEMTRDEL